MGRSFEEAPTLDNLNFQFRSQKNGFAISKNNYWKPSAELFLIRRLTSVKNKGLNVLREEC